MTEQASQADEEPVRYEECGAIAVITLNRPRYRNAQNSAMTYALDAAFSRAVNDSQIAVIVLAGAGEHFSAGQDIGTPGRDVDTSFDRPGMESVFGLHHLAHAHNAEVSGNSLAGLDARSMKKAAG